MTIARMIDEASSELSAVESVVATARHVIDIAVDTEHVRGRIVARAKAAVVVILVIGATLGAVYGFRVMLARRGQRSVEAETPVDEELVHGAG